MAEPKHIDLPTSDRLVNGLPQFETSTHNLTHFGASSHLLDEFALEREDSRLDRLMTIARWAH